MTDPSNRRGWEQEHPGTYSYPVEPGETRGPGPSYEPPPQSPAGQNPTRQLPAYSPYGYQAYGTYGGPPGPPDGQPPEPPEPRGGRPRILLWVLAGVALLLAVGLALSLYIDSSSQEPMGSPSASSIEPTMSEPSTTTTRVPTTTSRTTLAPTPTPSTTAPPPDGSSGAMHVVTYTVAGEGRAISILYLDTGGVLSTEFNVPLPWTKQVQLAGQANSSASVSIVNVGHDISCSIDVDGVQTQQTTGMGFTLCTALGR